MNKNFFTVRVTKHWFSKGAWTQSRYHEWHGPGPAWGGRLDWMTFMVPSNITHSMILQSTAALLSGKWNSCPGGKGNRFRLNKFNLKQSWCIVLVSFSCWKLFNSTDIFPGNVFEDHHCLLLPRGAASLLAIEADGCRRAFPNTLCWDKLGRWNPPLEASGFFRLQWGRNLLVLAYLIYFLAASLA